MNGDLDIHRGLCDRDGGTGDLLYLILDPSALVASQRDLPIGIHETEIHVVDDTPTLRFAPKVVLVHHLAIRYDLPSLLLAHIYKGEPFTPPSSNGSDSHKRVRARARACVRACVCVSGCGCGWPFTNGSAAGQRAPP